MPAVSLFTEAIQRADRLEQELKVAKERIRNLEIALTAAQRDKRHYQSSRPGAVPYWQSGMANNLNSLSEDDVKELFENREQQQQPKKRWWEFFK